jgi:AraC-like DNA-binding protein
VAYDALAESVALIVEAIAARAGYRQPSYFIKHFHRDHTVTPAAWRRRTRSTSTPMYL